MATPDLNLPIALDMLLRDVNVTRATSQLWHPRRDADRAHRWLRHGVQAVCAAA